MLDSWRSGLRRRGSVGFARPLEINIRSPISRAARAKRGARGFSPGGETRQRTGETRKASAMPGLGAVPARGTVRRDPWSPGSAREPPPSRAPRFFLSTRTRQRSRAPPRRGETRRASARRAAAASGRADVFHPSFRLLARRARPADLRRARSLGREGFEWHERARFAQRDGTKRGGEAARARRPRRRQAPELAAPPPGGRGSLDARAFAARHLRRPAR